MNEIKRFSWNGLYGMEELPDGDYVLYCDHEAEIARAFDDAHCKVSYPEEDCPITFGMIREARKAVDYAMGASA